MSRKLFADDELMIYFHFTMLLGLMKLCAASSGHSDSTIWLQENFQEFYRLLSSEKKFAASVIVGFFLTRMASWLVARLLKVFSIAFILYNGLRQCGLVKEGDFSREIEIIREKFSESVHLILNQTGAFDVIGNIFELIDSIVLSGLATGICTSLLLPI